jgi:23S rRNA (cytosine1962-C5)-methyltransferase
MADPGGRPVLRVFSNRPGQVLDRRYVAQVVKRCVRLRRRLLSPGPEDCYRVINGDSEGLPAVTVDRYGRYLVCVLSSPVLEQLLPHLSEALGAALDPAAIYLQRRYGPPDPASPRPGAELVAGQPAPPEVEVTEGRVRFLVDVSAPSGTGVFLDMRLGRQAVAGLAAGRRVLNCFSYTGAFSVVAARAGAAEVVSVDTSSRAHGRARLNFAANDLDPGHRRFEFVTADALSFLARQTGRGRRFDLVILDPPTFSSGKGRPFAAAKDYAELVAAALDVLETGGVLCVACNTIKLPHGDLTRSIGRGAHRAGRRLAITRRIGQPPDYPVLPGFPEGEYLKFYVIEAD